jgi:hypothetical protein
MNTTLRLLSLLVPAGLFAAGLSAQSISITNPSFELSSGYNGGATSTVTGWVAQTSTFGDVSNVSPSGLNQFTTGLSGTNALYINGGVSQLTASTFETGRVYTLTVNVGNPSGGTPNANGIQFGFRNAANNGFISGGVSFLTASTVNSVADGAFQTFTIAYTAVAGDNGNGVRIGLTDFFEGSATYRIDNVTLSASPIPEPSSAAGLAGLSALGMLALRRRRAPHA